MNGNVGQPVQSVWSEYPLRCQNITHVATSCKKCFQLADKVVQGWHSITYNQIRFKDMLDSFVFYFMRGVEVTTIKIV